MQATRVEDKVYMITYLNAFDGKMAYQLRDKDPRTIRDAFRIVVDIENNLRISGKLGSKRDDPRLFGNKGNRKEEYKLAANKKHEPTKISQILNAIKGLNPQTKVERNPIETKAPYQPNFNRKNRLQNFLTTLLRKMVNLLYPLSRM